MTEMKLILVK